MMNFCIKYGTPAIQQDISKNIYEEKQENYLYIPCGDLDRSLIAGDPVRGVLKSIYIYTNDKLIREFDHSYEIFIDINDNKIYSNNVPNHVRSNIKSKASAADILKNIHSKLKINYGSFDEEYPEQLMSVKYIKGHEKVLEIGGNIGRNSLIISYILNSFGNTDMVVLESDIEFAKQLQHNKDFNKAKFHIETSALSLRPLIQRGWETIESSTVLEGYKRVNIINYTELKNKYNLEFDTLVLDCEGAFYYILLDMSEILDNINLIIMENDYVDYAHKQFVDNKLIANGFEIIYNCPGGWGPCYNCFFQTWKKK